VLDDVAVELEEIGELELDGSVELDVLELCAVEELAKLDDVELDDKAPVEDEVDVPLDNEVLVELKLDDVELDNKVLVEVEVDVLELEETGDEVDKLLLKVLGIIDELKIELELVELELEVLDDEVLVEVEVDVIELDDDEAAADDIEDDVELIELELDDAGGAGQSCAWMKAELSVIDAPRANRPPMLVDSAFAVIETAARTLPTKVEPNPRVALVPTCQNTLQG
jgi:hypothetical protein